MKDRKTVILSILGLTILVSATLGIAYAIFNYIKEGTTENTVTVGNLKFLYTEVSGIGNGISITDALPISDTEGKAQTGAGKVFDFKVEASTPGTASIPYEITAAKTSASTLEENVVKVYLTEVNGNSESATPLTYNGTKVLKYSDLTDTEILNATGKTIYNGIVPSNTSNYLKTFKVRMWIDENTEFASGNYNGKTFTLKINVYANALSESNTETVATVPSDACFSFTSGTINKYYSNEGNNPINKKCPKKVIIPSTINGENVTIIGDDSFNGIGLMSVTIPEGVTSIAPTSFSNNQLTTVEIPKTVTSVEKYAFKNNKLTSLILNEGITLIGSEAFLNNQLTSVDFPSTVTTINNNAFAYNKLTSLTIPASVTVLLGQAFNNNLLPDSQAFIYERNSDGTEDKTTIISYGGAKKQNVIIPEGIITIKVGSFEDNALESITLPESVEIIENTAFRNNKLSSITIPSNLRIIRDGVFANNQLTTLNIPSTVAGIGDGSFNNNQLPDDQAFIYERKSDGSENKNKVVSYAGAKRDNIIIPANVTSIGSGAFSSLSLTSITIPSTVMEINSQAFATNKLTSVKIVGKTSPSDFTLYSSTYGMYGWAEGYNDSNIIWNGAL